MRILSKNHCGEIRCTAFKQRELFQDVLCRHDYAGRLIASFANKIQSEYYGGNISVYIEGIALEHFSALPQAYINSTKLSHQRHALFHSFLYDDSKQDVATITAHSNCLIILLKEKN